MNRRYAITYTPSAAKELRALDKPVRRRVLVAIGKLADDPRPTGCKALQGREGCRIRIGDYRVIYQVTDAQVTVLVLRIGARGAVYR
jgi:mRNA interferase RelE/StbE